MGCQRTITFAQNVGARLTPLHTAVYVASTDKILGTQMDHIIEFNATTGDYIRDAQTPWPMVGNMHLGLIDGLPYVAGHNNPAARDIDGFNYHEGYDIYAVDPVTLAIGTGLQVYRMHLTDYPTCNQEGPFQFIQVGTKLFFIQPATSGYFLNWINKTGWGAGVFGVDWRYKGFSGIWAEQICSDGTYIYIADPYFLDLSQRNFPLMNEVGWGPFPSPTGGEIGCEYAPNAGKVFAVCGNKYLERVDDFAAHTASIFDMEFWLAQNGVTLTGMKPIRLRYRPSNGNLYIPCQNKDGVIVFSPTQGTVVNYKGDWDIATPYLTGEYVTFGGAFYVALVNSTGVQPGTDPLKWSIAVATGIAWKSGFESPVDVVFTPTKAFAVQSSINGLKEIV